MGAPRGFGRRSMGVVCGNRSMLREGPFLRWEFLRRWQKDGWGSGRVRLPPLKEGLGRGVAVVGGNSKGLRGPRVFHDSVQLPTDPAAFGCDFFACFFVERYYKSNEFERSEQAVVVLGVDNDVVIRSILNNSVHGVIEKLLVNLTTY
ncbi:MAG: hypothetical protein QME78_09255 [Thermodesulfobacteriota bacterium]|nr:hypothetical protein [Thermodesulfobacteriota bacterium]